MALALPSRGRSLRRLGALLGALLLYVVATYLVARRYQEIGDLGRTARVEVRGGWFYRGGEKLLLNAVGYDPSRPGELPWERQHSSERLEADLLRIRAAGFDGVRVWESMTVEELDIAERLEVSVIQGIWVDPDGDFADPAFRAAAVQRAHDAATAASGQRAVVAWLLMNEPRPDAVRKAGLDATRSLLRELATAVRLADPGVPVGFASWPGLEALDEPSLDFVAANLYPFRPSGLVETVGYAGMVSLWKRERAPTRPLLVSEYGLSVAPLPPLPDAPGGLDEQQQADRLPAMADDISRAGAGGSALFMWIDGWWKNNEAAGDEKTHDPADGEEWFGLVAMEDLNDVEGRERPALAAMKVRNRAILTLPFDGAVPGREVELEAHVQVDGELWFEVGINGGPAQVVPSVREGGWLRARQGLLAQAAGPQELDIAVVGASGEVARWARRVSPPGQELTLELDQAGGDVVVRVRDGAGQPVPDVLVRLSLSEATRRYDRVIAAQTGADGTVSVPVEVPDDVLALLVAGAVGEEAAPPLALDWLVLAPETSMGGPP
jgi:hypothetical protein